VALEAAANAEAANAAAGAARPERAAAGAKPPKPDTLTGFRDAHAVRAWVAQVNNFYAAVQEPVMNRLSFSVALLRDNTLLWWQSLTEDKRPGTWEAMSEQMIKFFAPISATIIARERLASLRQ
jgi:hypothetical protein